MKGRFHLGRLMATPGVLRALEETNDGPLEYVCRHLEGDWGDVSPDDAALNDEAVASGDRILSAYNTPGGKRIWVLTEADRSATTILLPSEY